MNNIHIQAILELQTIQVGLIYLDGQKMSTWYLR